jgi:predicted O-linked N-acetylglucosamine transferase (SPINDLY family)
VAHYIAPVIAGHDRACFEVTCYYSCPLRDAITDRIAASADRWLDCAAMSPGQLADRVRRDGIDILVDLAGHTVGNRALLFAIKPAPVQIAYLGYPSTTGLSTVDYRMTDAFADPPGLNDDWFCERPCLLAPSMITYLPPFGPGGLNGYQTIEVMPTPALRNGWVTFGCFNEYSKISDDALGTWGKILQAVPGSRLVLKPSQGLPADGNAVLERFSAHGINAERLILLGRDVDKAAHLGRYAAIDISLDTFPYNGVTTTCESVWMGVPFVTLAGGMPASRMGVSIASNLGRREWIAGTLHEYVRIAATLAADVEQLDRIRQSLRQGFLASPIADSSGFTRELESCYRRLWHQWCTTTPGRREPAR